MKVTGKLAKILEKQTGQKKDGSGEWVKQLFLVETDEQYNNLYCFEVFGDEKVENLNKYNKEGDNVTVEFNVSTNEWQGRYFTTLKSWRIEKAGLTINDTKEIGDVLQADEIDDDLPFS